MNTRLNISKTEPALQKWEQPNWAAWNDTAESITSNPGLGLVVVPVSETQGRGTADDGFCQQLVS